MKLKTTLLWTLAAYMLVSCNKDDINGGSSTQPGEESVVTLIIYDATISTRAADTDTDTPTLAESAIDPSLGIKVVVFNADGTLAYPLTGSPLNLSLTETGPNTGIYQSGEFKVNAGEKYFYVFANDGNNVVTAPSSTMTRSQFIARTTAATLDNDDLLDLTDPNFLMGSLWSEKQTAPAGGQTGAPETVYLSIGRLVSKVTLSEVSQGTSTMNGTFSDPEYRLGTIPKKLFLVGNNDENRATPPDAGHGVVVSAVHYEPIYSGATDANYQQYTATWKGVNNVTPQSFYTVENTTAPNGAGIQFYGNTSYIQLRTVYTPDPTEVFRVEDLSAQGSFTGPTFYTANLISTGARIIFEEDPREGGALTPDPDIDQNTIQVYTNGLNYHKFPIHDTEVGLPEVQKNTVLRNHSYRYKVTSIADLGKPDGDVDPTEPIETETTLIIEVTVSDWSKIENNNVPI